MPILNLNVKEEYILIIFLQLFQSQSRETYLQKNFPLIYQIINLMD
jgi:hypothetical protein